MPTLSANIKWTTNLDDLRKELKSGNDQLVVLQSSAERTIRSLGGEGLIRAAHNAAAAVQELGGANKLTASEQDKINSLMDRAIAKYQALGQQAPTALKQLQQATERTEQSTSLLSKALDSTFGHLVAGVASGELVAEAFKKIGEGVFEAVKALPELVDHTIRTGSEIFALSQKTGISVEALSKLRYVAAQTGTDLGSLTTAIFKLEANLGTSGDKASTTKAALDKLGLSMGELKAASPDEAFARILEKLGALPTAADRARVGMDLFGKGFKEIAQIATEDIRGLLQEAQDLGIVMTTDMAAAAKAADDALTLLKFQVEGVANRLGVALLPAVIGISADISTLFKGAIAAANAELEHMGKPGGGTLSLVAQAMGTGDGAIAAQTALYEELRGALISLVRGGLEPLITAIGFLGKEWDAALVLGNAVVNGYQAITYGAEGLLLVLAEIAKVTDPFGASKAQQNINFLKADLDRLYNSMAQGQANIDRLKQSEQDWGRTTASINAEIEAGLKKVETSHVDVAAVIKKVADLSRQASRQVTGDMADEGSAADSLRDKFVSALGELTTKIDEAVKHHVPLNQQVALFGDAASKAAQEADVWGVHVAADVKAVAAAFNAAKLDEKVTKATQGLNKEAEQRTKSFFDGLITDSNASFTATQKASADNLQIVEDAQRSTQRIIQQSTQATLHDQLAAIHDQAEAWRAALQARGQYTQEALAKIEQYERVASVTATRYWLDGGAKRKDELRSEAEHAKQQYEYMRQSGLYTYAEIEAAAKRSADAQKAYIDSLFQHLLDVADTALGKFDQIFGELANSTGGGLQGIFADLQAITRGWNEAAKAAQDYAAATTTIGKLAALGEGVGAIASATDPRGKSTAATVGGGAAAGFRVGSSFGPAGAIIGLGVGALIGWWRSAHAEWRKVANDIGKDIGQDISQGLAQQIADLEKTIVGGTKNQRRHWAELLSLPQLEQASGGLNAKNLEQFEAQAKGLFELIQRGGEAGAEATGVLNDQIAQFAAQAEKTGGLWDPVFQSLIKQSQALGVNLDSVNQALDAQIQKLGGGLSKVVSGAFANTNKQLGGITQGLSDQGFSSEQIASLSNPDAAKKTLTDLNNSGEGSKAKAFESALSGVTDLTAGAQDQFDRLSRIALASFNTIVAGGKSAFDAVGQLGDSIDQLIAEHDKLGLHGGAAYDELARLRTLTKDNDALIQSVSGLNDVLTALSNLGGLDANSFADLEAQGVDAFHQMTAAGFTQQEAEQALVPFLQNILDLHDQTGLAIDDETQKLIDQAKQDGVLKEKQISTNQILVDGIGALIKAVGGDLPDSFKKFSEQAKKSTDEVADNVKKKIAKDATQDTSDATGKMQADFERWKTVSVGHIKDVEGELRGGLTDAAGNVTIDPIRVPYYYDAENAPPGGSGDTSAPSPPGTSGDTPHASGGGVMGMGRIIPFPVQHFAKGIMAGPVARVVDLSPQGPDTQPAMLAVGEVVQTPQQWASTINAMELGRHALESLNALQATGTYGGGEPAIGPIRLVNNTYLDKRLVARSVVDVLPNEAKRLGVRVTN